MQKTDIDPAVFLQSIPQEFRGDMSRLDQEIDQILREPRTVWTGVFWGGSDQTIIGYGDLIQPRPRGKTVEWFKVGLARQKTYISVYINAVDGHRYLTEVYGPRLGKVKVGKAAISFRSLRDLNLPTFRELLITSAQSKKFWS